MTILLKRLAILGGVLACSSGLFAQADPSRLPLVQPGDLHYVGGFRVPEESRNGFDLSYGGGPIAFNPANHSLFIGTVYGSAVGEISIPAPLNNSDPQALPMSALVQPFTDPTEGHKKELSTSSTLLGGLLVRPDRLIGTAAIFFDTGGTARVSHFTRSTSLAKPSFSGWSKVWDHPGFVAGYMADIPAEWQSRLGGTAITGQCCLSIISRTSLGPSAFVFDPSQVGQPTVPAAPLLYYPLTHPTLGPYEASNQNYGATTQMGGVVVIPGTRSALYFGSTGTGPHCYGGGTADKSKVGTTEADGTHWCYDPQASSKGYHAYPYNYQVWAYDLNDFAAVKAGKKQPWEILPYGVWPLTLPTPIRPGVAVSLGGVTFDAQTRTIYLSQYGANIVGCCGVLPVMHAFGVKDSTATPPRPIDPPPVPMRMPVPTPPSRTAKP